MKSINLKTVNIDFYSYIEFYKFDIVNNFKLDSVLVEEKWCKIFTYGTITAEWDEHEYFEVKAIVNAEKGNGHFKELISELKSYCSDIHKPLLISDITHIRFLNHLINHHQFTRITFYSKNIDCIWYPSKLKTK